MLVSVIIRTLNEQKYLSELLDAVGTQNADFDVEVVLVDSGSTDSTLPIAEAAGCRIVHIDPEHFTFGRSLNVGCRAARGTVFVFVSGHCVPAGPEWLASLVQPIFDDVAQYSYGRQLGRDTTKFSESQVFDKFYPPSKKSEKGFFCNNANAALRRDVWERFEFNERLTGLEDMYLARLLVEAGGQVAYVPEAPVWHIHDETMAQVRLRYEREALALARIVPEIRLSLMDTLRYGLSAMLSDLAAAKSGGILKQHCLDIVRFRYQQYLGSWLGHRAARNAHIEYKREYFYPVRNPDVADRTQRSQQESMSPIAHSALTNG
ncbi:MAG: glycosyltransferase family A protein [Pseudomonadota bacterium]